METMEWTKQAEDMFKAWTEAQKRMWDDWLKTVQGFGRSQTTEMWDMTVKASEESIKKALDSQVEWTRLWADNFNTASGTPKELVEWVRQGQDLIRRSIETQKQLWTAWFEIVKKFDPSALSRTWTPDNQKFVETWQENIQKTLEAQAEWMRLWTAGSKR